VSTNDETNNSYKVENKTIIVVVIIIMIIIIIKIINSFYQFADVTAQRPITKRTREEKTHVKTKNKSINTNNNNNNNNNNNLC
jgi:hypothetical protein